MADFETNALLLKEAGITVVAASVDSVEDAETVAAGLRVRYVNVLAELDGPAVAAATDAQVQTGERTFLQATGFLVNPDGEITDSVYSSGPIGRFVANDILKVVAFRKGVIARGD